MKRFVLVSFHRLLKMVTIVDHVVGETPEAAATSIECKLIASGPTNEGINGLAALGKGEHIISYPEQDQNVVWYLKEIPFEPRRRLPR